MKKHTTRVVALFGFLFVLAATPAFPQDGLVAANVPFKFSTAERTLPAGKYTVTEIGTTGMQVLVQEFGGSGRIASLQELIRPVKGAGKAKLVFHRYDGQYFLAQVISTDNTTRRLSMTRTEKLVIKNRADHKLAQNKVEPEVVTVMAAQR